MDSEEVRSRLEQLGYTVEESDSDALDFAVYRTEEKIKNACNTLEVPDGLHYKAVDMACGEFLKGAKAKGLLDGTAVEGDRLVKTVSEGDTSVTYQDSTAESTLTKFIAGLCGAAGDADFARYRKLVW